MNEKQETKLDKILKHVPGFRSKTTWKMIVAILYYIFTLFTRDFWMIIFGISVPFFIFSIADLIKTRKSNVSKKPILITLVVSLIFVLVGGYIIGEVYTVDEEYVEAEETDTKQEEKESQEGKNKEDDEQKDDGEQEDNVPQITIDELPYEIIIEKSDYNEGQYDVDIMYTNNSEYPVKRCEMTVLLKDKGESVPAVSTDTVMPGETSPKFRAHDAPESGEKKDVEIREVDIWCKDKDGENTFLIKHDIKLKEYEVFIERKKGSLSFIGSILFI